jgi:hypothetical protein
MAESGTSAVQVDGVVATFADYDGLIEALRERAASMGLSYATVDCLCEFAEGGTGKYLSDARARQLTVAPLLKIAEVLAIKGLFVEDAELLRRMKPFYEKRDELKAHARRRAPLGAVTLRRVLPAAAAEMGKRGAIARNSRLAPEVRSALARAAARARWRRCDPRS